MKRRLCVLVVFGLLLISNVAQAKQLPPDLRAATQERIARWLDSHPLDLDVTPQFQVGNYLITATARDFKGDGDHEWLLAIRQKTNRFLYGSQSNDNYLIAERTDKNRYRLIQTPLPWFDDDHSYYSIQSGIAQSMLFADINGDNVPEWVVAVGGVGGGHMDFGWLYILTWRQDEIVNLATYGPDDINSLDYASPAGAITPLFPYRVNIEFVKSLNHNALDIVVYHQVYDTWDCDWLETRIFSWNGSIYALAKRDIAYKDSRNCAWRNAEANVWKGNYQAAIEYYRHGFQLDAFSLSYYYYDPDDQIELNQYMQLRFALALSLDGQAQQADEQMNILAKQKPESDLIAQFIQALTPISTAQPYAFCLAAYNVVNQYLPTELSADQDFSYAVLPTRLVIGMTMENYGPPFSYLPFPDPKRAGCDISVPLRRFF